VTKRLLLSYAAASNVYYRAPLPHILQTHTTNSYNDIIKASNWETMKFK